MKRKLPVLQPSSQHINNIAVDRIKESIVTLRVDYDKDRLRELGDSIDDKGQIQTIVVQPDDKDPGHYELVIGSRRLRAVRQKGKRFISAFIIEKRDPAELLIIALAENLHRDDLNPFEEAGAFLRLTKEHGLSSNEIAERINKPHSYVTGRLQILTMPDEVIGMVADRRLPVKTVRTLARLPTGDDQVRHARTMIKHHLSQDELSSQIRQELHEPVRAEQNPYEFTSVKLVARLEMLSKFAERVPLRIRLDRLNAIEKAKVKVAIGRLESKLQSIRNMLDLTSSIMVSRSSTITSSDAENMGQEWTVADINLITSENRPSDPELALEIGRSVSAIKSMRAKVSQK